LSEHSSGFYSEALQQAIDDSKHIIENFAEIRNQISKDIKELENYLNSHAPKEDFIFSLGENFFANDEYEFSQRMDEYGQGEGRMQEEILAWKSDLKGRFRLFYDLIECNALVEVDGPGGPYFKDKNSISCQSKPLIECNFDVRKRMITHLPSFVKALATHLSSAAGLEDPFGEDDRPFF
jgi:hypothetical protein